MHAPQTLPGRSIHTRTPWRAALAGLLLAAAHLPAAHAQTEPFMGQLMLVASSYCPKDWLEANGQMLSISDNPALYSLLGTSYGGNGHSTFALPDLRGRVPVGQGTGPGLSPVVRGQSGGTETVTLFTSQLPPHTHALQASSQPATHAAPANDRALAVTQNAGSYVQGSADTALAANSIGATGGGQPVPIRNPYLGMRWCINVFGVYPSQP